jgi:hypothetical protein
MVHTSQPESTAHYTEPMDFSSLLDPSLLQTARQIYRTYYEVHPEQTRRPIGIAIDRTNHRGKLIFGQRAVLLPKECFVPLSQIEMGVL